MQLKIDTFCSSYALLRTNDAGWYSFPNILIVLLVIMLYFMMFYVQRASEHSFRSQCYSLVMWGEKYLACHVLLEVGRSLGDLRKRTGNKVLIRTSCHFCPQLFCWSSQSCRSTSIMGLFRVWRLCRVLISHIVLLRLPFYRHSFLVNKTLERQTIIILIINYIYKQDHLAWIPSPRAKTLHEVMGFKDTYYVSCQGSGDDRKWSIVSETKEWQ